MKRISIDVVGLAAVAWGSGCSREFEPAQPWYLPAGQDDGDDGGDDGSDDGDTTGEPPAGEADDGDPGGGDELPPMDSAADDAGGDTMGDDAGADSGEVGDGPPESPYQGGWDIGDCQNDIPAPTNDPGGTIEDLTFTDQYGDVVRLYDFCHKAILLVEGAFW